MKICETTLEIDLNALANNYSYLRSKISPNTRLMAVVKANSYGSDSVAIAQKLEQLGADYFAVAYTHEGVLLRQQGIQKPILVLHPLECSLQTLIEYHLEPNLYSLGLLQKFIALAQEKQCRNYPVHIKINSGMNRIGIHPQDQSTLADLLTNNSCIEVVSVFSHLAASEDVSHREFALRQIKTYLTTASYLENKLGKSFIKHTLNTSGILHFPEAHLDMVRSGIGLYGYSNDPIEDQNLRPVATLKTLISQIHSIKEGDYVGYNFGYSSPGNKVIATLPLGHADGISRAYGKGKGVVYIHGQKAPTVGNICMDMLMVDVTDIDCQEGDPVIVFGQGASAESFAQGIGSISYEIITAISARIKRIVKS